MDEITKTRVSKMMPLLSEDQRRKYVALEAQAMGRTGVAEMHELTGMSKTTIYQGIKETQGLEKNPKAKSAAKSRTRIRKPGGGRKRAETKQPELKNALLSLLDGNTIGNPENPLCWTTKSLDNLSNELQKKGFSVSRGTVERLLTDMGFSLQQNRKYTEAGNPGPDRDGQFNFINDKSKDFLSRGLPVISVDTKKKELIGNFKNTGAEYRPQKDPLKVMDHDFPIPENGKASPYGIYDIGRNEGFVNVGLSADTGAFAVNSIRLWWNSMGMERYPDARELYITADGGGSNGRRNRLWKTELQNFANESGLKIHVSHFPPGTSKWNKIEHRLFSQISKNWRGRPLETIAVIVSLISSTTTAQGLTVHCAVDPAEYPKGTKISDAELSKVSIMRNDWHGEWNYCIEPATVS